MQSQTFTPQATYSVVHPEPGVTIYEAPLKEKYYTVHVRVKDAGVNLDIDAYVKVLAVSHGDAIAQSKQAFRSAYKRGPYYETYEVLP